jgi:uncharacterized protein YggE
MPDRATVRVGVDGDGSSREVAYRAAAGLAAAVDGVLEAQSSAVERVTTTALIVQPTTRARKGETVRTGWRAYRSSVVEITALERVGELLALIVAAGGSVSGLSWELDSGHDAYDEARRRAAQDATRRAQQYASALGIKPGAVAWVAEPGLRTGGGATGPVFRAMAASASGLPGGMAEQLIDVPPEEITVRASVEVGFSIQ